MTDAAAARRAELQRLSNSLAEVTLEARKLRSEIDSQPKSRRATCRRPARSSGWRRRGSCTIRRSRRGHARCRHRRSCSRACAARAGSRASRGAAAGRRRQASRHRSPAALLRRAGEAARGGARRGGDDEAATLRAQLSLVHEKGVALRRSWFASRPRAPASSGTWRRAGRPSSRAARPTPCFEPALDESKAALRRLGARVEASE